MTMRPFTDNRGGLNHLVDAQIGRAFPVVHKVYKHLDAIEYVAQVYESGRSRDIVIRTNHTKEWIEWQYKGEATWTILFKFSDLLGADIADVVAAEQAIAAELETLRVRILQIQNGAVGASDRAQAAELGAVDAKNAAEAAQASAQTSAQEASASAIAAAQSAQGINEVRATAEVFAATAATHRDAAAQSAQQAADSADSAHSAKDTAVSARAEAVSFASAASTSSTEAKAAQQAAESFAQAAGQSEAAALVAAETASDVAQASAVVAAQFSQSIDAVKAATEAIAATAETHRSAAALSAQEAAASAGSASNDKDAVEAIRTETAGFASTAVTASIEAKAAQQAAEAQATAAEQSAQIAGQSAQAVEQSAAAAQSAADAAASSATSASESAQIAAAHQVASEAAATAGAQHLADVEAQVVSAEALKQETIAAHQAGLVAKASAEEAAVNAATFAENSDVSAAESATSANEAEASANAADLNAQAAATHKADAENQAVAAATSAQKATDKATAAEVSALAAAASATTATEKLGEVSTLHDAAVTASTTATDAAETASTYLAQVTALHSATESFAQAAQASAEQADSAATAAGVSAGDALLLRNETQGFHDAASAMVVDAAQVSADRATVQTLAQEVQLAANQAQSNALAAADSADTAVASASAAANSATDAQANADVVQGQVTAITGRLDEADTIVATVTTLRDETLSYKLAVQDSTTNAQSVAADRAAVTDMMGTIAADAASAADSKDQALAAAATAVQAETAANTAITVAQNAAQEVAANISAAQDAAAGALDSQIAAANSATAALNSSTQSADSAAKAAVTASQVETTAGQVSINAQQVADDVVTVITAKNEAVDSRDRAETAAVNAGASASVANAAKASATDSANQAAVSFAGVVPLHTEVVSKHADVLAKADQVSEDLLAVDAAKVAAEAAQADAETAEVLARAWAIKMDGPVLNDGGDKFSAQYWAAQAEQLAADAADVNTGALGALANHTAATDPHTQYQTKVESADALATKVDKEVGKRLSTEDFTSADKAKLDGVEDGANAYIHPDNHPASVITQDANNRFVTDAEKAAWNAKQDILVSGANIKTINGESLLGKGDVVVTGSGSGGPTLQGDTSPYLAQTTTYQITNYNSFSSYGVSASAGTASISGDTITYTAPSTAGSVDLTLTVDGQPAVFVITVQAAGVTTPTNTIPVDGATGITDSPTLQSSAFATYGQVDTHLASRWTLYQDGVEVHSSGWLTDALTSYTIPVGVVSAAQAYTWTVEYRGTSLGDSPASDATGFTTVLTFNNYIPTPTPTPANFGDPFEGGFYMGLFWNQIAQSTSSKTLATGAQTFTVPDMTTVPIVYSGQTLEVRSRANPANKFMGTVTGASGTTLSLNVTSIEGSGTFSDWSVMSRFRHIVAPKSSGEHTGIALKNANTALPVACQTLTEGWEATLAMVAAGDATMYPAAHWARNLTIGGKNDWHIPARDVLELSWRNGKPTTDANYITANRPAASTFNYTNNGSYGDTANTHGLNNNSAPVGAAYTAAVPAQTSAAAFRTGGAEAFEYGSVYYWSSSDYDVSRAWGQRWLSSSPGLQGSFGKSSATRVRAARRSII